MTGKASRGSACESPQLRESIFKRLLCYTSRRHIGQDTCLMSHLSTHTRWKVCEQRGRLRTVSPTSMSCQEQWVRAFFKWI